MSWDVLILAVPPGIHSVAELPDGFDPALGPLPDVLLVVKDLFPTINLRDPSWGVLVGDTYSIEFNIGKADPCRSVMLHVRGDESAIGPIRALYNRTGWRALDMSAGELLDLERDPGKSLRSWGAYRNGISPGAPNRGVLFTLPGGGQVVVDAVAASSPAPKQTKPWWRFWR
jgi:hypothetical protein